jgi:hypothetical protein
MNFHQIRKTLPMSCSRYIALSFLLLGASFFTFPDFAHCQQTQPAAKSSAPAPPAPPKADPKADETINQLVAQFDPKKIGWMETNYSLQSSIQGAVLHIEGRYLLGPDYRVRMDLALRIGKAKSDLLTVCDGTTLWNTVRIDGEHRGTNRWDLKTVLAALNAPGSGPQSVEEFAKSQALLGLLPLLKSLKQNMVFTKQEPDPKGGLKLTAVWSPDVTKSVAAPNTQWPLLVPRKAYAYVGTLEGKYLWPYRIEWWGPVVLRGDDVLLLEMQFRDPKILKPDDAAAKRLAQECSYDPGKDEVVDRTKAIIDQLAHFRMQQGARPPTTSPPGK